MLISRTQRVVSSVSTCRLFGTNQTRLSPLVETTKRILKRRRKSQTGKREHECIKDTEKTKYVKIFIYSPKWFNAFCSPNTSFPPKTPKNSHFYQIKWVFSFQQCCKFIIFLYLCIDFLERSRATAFWSFQKKIGRFHPSGWLLYTYNAIKEPRVWSGQEKTQQTNRNF